MITRALIAPFVMFPTVFNTYVKHRKSVLRQLGAITRLFIRMMIYSTNCRGRG